MSVFLNEHIQHLKTKLENEGALTLYTKVITGAQKTEFTEILLDDHHTLKLKINAIPEDNKANKEIIKFLQKEFSAQAHIIHGKLNDRKTIELTV